MKNIYKSISFIFQPLFIPTYAIILLFFAGNFSATNFIYKTLVVVSIFTLTALMPLLCIFLLKITGVVHSIQLNEQKERTAPYIFTILFYTSVIFLMWRIYMPFYIINMMIGCILSLFFITIINKWWKISAHLCGMGGLCASVLVVSLYINIDFSKTIAILFILSGLVATSRIALKSHNIMQTLMGFLVGFCTIFISGIFF